MKNSRPASHSHPFFTSSPAFTLLEILIVTIIVAILAVSLALGFRGARNHATFTDHQTQIISLMQKARGLSLSNLLVDTDGDGTGDEPTYYYLLALSTNLITLTAYTESNKTYEIEKFTFDNGFSLVSSEGEDDTEVYYFPPYGEICFGTYHCDASTTEKTFTLTGPEGESVTINLSAQGGYPEVVD